MLSKLKTDYQSHLRDIVPSSDYMRYLEKRLSEIYKAGILSTEERSKLQKDSTAVIMVIDDKLANQRGTEQLFPLKTLMPTCSLRTRHIILRISCASVHSTNICTLI